MRNGFSVQRSSALLSCLASDSCPFVKHHRSIHAQNLLIIGSISQHRFLAARLQIMLSSCGCDDVVLCVDNNDIQDNCEELVQLFEKFVVMAVNPGVDVDTHSVHP